ncbi:MAG: aldehyde dehydrogenase [Pigmentiphaga sp.]|nr:aldehyde dehydrogenase [Pigmentiphaga sp.]
MKKASLLIDNNDVWAADGRTFDRLNPLTGEIVSRSAAATKEDMEGAVQAAATAFLGWAKVSPEEKRRLLMKSADVLESHQEAFQDVMRAETGCTASWVASNVRLGASMLREAGAMTTQLGGEVIPANRANTLALAIRQPVGVVLGIAPWNAPVALGIRAVASAIACGNTTILKTSEYCPATHRLIGSVFQKAGLPAGVCNILSSASEDAASIVQYAIEHPAVRRVNFTGSTHVGKAIAQVCAKQLKPVLLELGGKSPLVVLNDANIDDAVNAALFGAFNNQGQICMSTDRIIVDESIADEFVARFSARARNIRAVGLPVQGGNYGSMISDHAVKRAVALTQDAIEKGARLVVGNECAGSTMNATVLDHVTPSMAIYHEESFAPVAAVVRVAGEDEAVRVANDTEYGLVASVFTQDTGRGLDVASRLQTGICHINSSTVYNEPQMPFGGTKSSGYGRFGGRSVMEEFTELRWVTIQAKALEYPSLECGDNGG